MAEVKIVPGQYSDRVLVQGVGDDFELMNDEADALLRALVEQAGGVEVEVEHRAPQVQFGAGSETQPVMLKEHAVFVDPISVARKSKAGPALLLPLEAPE